MEIVEAKLREYETIAQQYTKSGTPDELRSLMGKMEELADELQMLDDNNAKSEWVRSSEIFFYI